MARKTKRRTRALARRHPASLGGVWDRLSAPQRRKAVWVGGLGILGLAGLWWAFSDADPRSGDDTFVMPWTVAEFVSNVYGAIDSAAPSLGTKSKLMVLAHAAYESGWGKATAAKEGNNLFNITAGSSWGGPVVGGSDTEYDSAGNVKSITQRFRAYGSVEESVADYINFLQGSRYSAAYSALVNGDPVGFVRALSAAHYFTLPEAQYESAFLSVLQKATNTWGSQA